jgi:hypothetical protein
MGEQTLCLGISHYLWWGVAPKAKRNVFRDKNFADPTIKKTKRLPNLNYQLKNNYPPLAKNVTKRY